MPQSSLDSREIQNLISYNPQDQSGFRPFFNISEETNNEYKNNLKSSFPDNSLLGGDSGLNEKIVTIEELSELTPESNFISWFLSSMFHRVKKIGNIEENLNLDENVLDTTCQISLNNSFNDRVLPQETLNFQKELTKYIILLESVEDLSLSKITSLLTLNDP